MGGANSTAAGDLGSGAGTLFGGPAGQVYGRRAGSSTAEGKPDFNPQNYFGDFQTIGNDVGSGSGDNMGVGMYKPQDYNVDESAFRDNSRIDALSNSLEDQRNKTDARNVTLDPTAQNQFRDYQGALAAQLMQQSQGGGPNLANAQLQKATENNIKQAMSLGTTRPGVSAALSQRNIMNQAAGANQAAAQNSAINRMQQQLESQNALGNLSGAARGQDITFGTNQANVALGQQQNNDAMNRFYTTGLANLNEQKQGNLMALQKLQADKVANQNATEAQSFADQQKRRGGMLGGLGQAAAVLAMNKGGVVKKMAFGGEYGTGAASRNKMGSYGLSAHSANINTGSTADMGGFAKAIQSYKKKKSDDDEPTKVESEGMQGGWDDDMMDNSSEPDSDMTGNEESESIMAAHGGYINKLNKGEGGHVPGEAEVEGDDLKNDKVPVMLSPGEIVLPRTVAQKALANPSDEDVIGFLDALRMQHMADGGEVDDEETIGSGKNVRGSIMDAKMPEIKRKEEPDKGMLGGLPGMDMLFGEGGMMADGGEVEEDQSPLQRGMRNAFHYQAPGAPTDPKKKKDEYESEPTSFTEAMRKAFGGK